jgi:hypothetical protein
VSFQGRDLLEFLPRSGPIPVGEKLPLMKRRPLDHKTCYARRQPSGKHGQCSNIDQRKVIAIFRVKVRWIVSSKNILMTMPKKRLISGMGGLVA